MSGIDVNFRVDRGYFWLRKLLVFFEIALVVRLHAAAHLCVAILVEDMRVVVVVGAAANGEQCEKSACGGEAGQPLRSETGAGGQGIVRATTSHQHRHDTEKRRDRKPVQNRPEN